MDTFLYARACVVANGKAFYEAVLRDPTKMPKEFTFEALLYLAGEAFEQKTGESWDYLPKLSYETFSNREDGAERVGWIRFLTPNSKTKQGAQFSDARLISVVFR